MRTKKDEIWFFSLRSVRTGWRKNHNEAIREEELCARICNSR